MVALSSHSARRTHADDVAKPALGFWLDGARGMLVDSAAPMHHDGQPLVLRAYGVSDKGRVRSTNEDHFAISERLRLLVVADGMGGHKAGEVASHVAVDAIVKFVADAGESIRSGWPFGFNQSLSEAANVLRTAVQLANAHVLEVASSAEEYAGMGTTVVAVLVGDGRVTVAHAGDSRLYVAVDGKLRQLTRDDSWLATMLATNPETDPTVLQ